MPRIVVALVKHFQYRISKYTLKRIAPDENTSRRTTTVDWHVIREGCICWYDSDKVITALEGDFCDDRSYGVLAGGCLSVRYLLCGNSWSQENEQHQQPTETHGLLHEVTSIGLCDSKIARTSRFVN
jgi:hypothetical protein